MKYQKNHLIWSAVIGFLLCLPTLVSVGLGEGFVSDFTAEISAILMFPGLLLISPIILLKPFFANPDRDLLGVIFIMIPVINFLLYSFATYLLLNFKFNKK